MHGFPLSNAFSRQSLVYRLCEVRTMRRQLPTAALTLICSLGALATGASSSQAAQLCYGNYWYAGSAPRVAYYSYYAPVVRYSAYYAPASCCPTTTYYAPACSPCGYCCGFGCGACCDPCSVCYAPVCPAECTPAQPNGTPEPAQDDSQWEGRTYQEDDGSGDSTEFDPGYGTRGEGRETQKPPADEDGQQVIQPREPAPVDIPVPDPVPQEGDSEEAEQPAGNEGEPEARREHPSLRVPTLDLDRKLTWRTAPSRARLTIRSSFGNATVSRRNVNVNAGWVPVPDGSTIARK